jgi:hypothetical protein
MREPALYADRRREATSDRKKRITRITPGQPNSVATIKAWPLESTASISAISEAG